MFITIILFILLSLALLWFMFKGDHGKKEPITILWTAAGFGLLALILAGPIETLFIPHTSDSIMHLGIGTKFFYALLIGVIEESLKFLPLAWYIYKKPSFNENVDGILYFAISGLTFGLLENILYVVSFGSEAAFRLLLTPFFHTAGTAILGYALIRIKLTKKPLTLLLPYFIGVIMLHAFYDFGLFSGIIHLIVVSLMISLLLDVGLFIFYAEAKAHDKVEGLSVNNFCQSCGRQNANRTIFCEVCGKKT
jgi:protease PrsW